LLLPESDQCEHLDETLAWSTSVVGFSSRSSVGKTVKDSEAKANTIESLELWILLEKLLSISLVVTNLSVSSGIQVQHVFIHTIIAVQLKIY
jgi:hypothetical protein